ncbi:DNA topoisomerase IV subunit A [Vibrio crassostreae]|uniref:DNA topoisomerase IV subunit A n=1 Tax=Vibrio crassostreae TaxID=246167 RepID=UPI001B311B13|nr:DNA topoisomerase IV subunit A [Vibrio crassostreae]
MNLEEFAALNEELYLSYAMKTLGGRAIPFVHDGLKPVHRRILYAMKSLGLTATSDYKKSARVVGDTIGQYHPHGDKSVYDAMVLMSQPWKMRYPLVDGQGNFGSRDGDTAAAMRYTESRVAPLGEVLLEEINLGSVDFKPNFDDSLKEPKYLPAPLPVLLLNGADGIAVGSGTDMPSHNIQEICEATLAVIKNPDITIEEIMEIIQGPDFATGGQIVSSKKDILKAYKTGQGKVKLRCRWKVIEKQRNQWEIEITELPYQMSANDVIIRINEAMKFEASDRNEKKAPKELELKNYIKRTIQRVDDITESKEGQLGAARLAVEPKKCNQSPEEFMDGFIKMFGLEKTVPINLFAISIDDRPSTRNIKGLIADWVAHRREVIKKRTNFRLDKVNARLELLVGRLSIMEHIDEVIAIVRDDENPEITLMERFELTERQANDIMEIKLRDLRRLEEQKLIDERDKLSSERDDLTNLLASKTKLNNLIGREVKKHTARFQDERRTLIQYEKPVTGNVSMNIANDPVTIFLTKDNWIVGRKGHIDEYPTGAGMLKPGDSFVSMIQTTLDKAVILFSATGRAYTVMCSQIPFGRNTAHINSLVNCAGEKIIKSFAFKEGEKFILAHSHGYGFIVSSDNLFSKQRTGKDVFSLKKYPDAEILLVENIEGAENICITTTRDRFMRFPISDMIDYEYPKGQGVKLSVLTAETFSGITLVNDEFIVNGEVLNLDAEKYHKKRSTAPVKL